MGQAALMGNPMEIMMDHLLAQILLREIHLFPQETWLQKAKSLLQKNGVKGHVYLEM